MSIISFLNRFWKPVAKPKDGWKVCVVRTDYISHGCKLTHDERKAQVFGDLKSAELRKRAYRNSFSSRDGDEVLIVPADPEENR